MATSKLQLFNGALLEIGERKIASLSEDIAARRELDRAWEASNGAVNYCLGQGQWKFAMRSVEIASSVSVTPAFGFAKAFARPSDNLKTISLCSDAYMQVPLLRYSQEQSYFFADIDPIYLSYVSNDSSYGGDYSLWPDDFCRYVELYLATKIAKKLVQSKEERNDLYALAKKALIDARSSSAMEGPTAFPPVGRWVGARLGNQAGRQDRGSRSALTG